MENHPIPQDITGFKFRLIGNITIKQFLYLLSAAVFSYLIFITGLYSFIKYPLILLVILFGLALAFLPVDGRPFDKMVANFFTALPRENKYYYGGKVIPSQPPVKIAETKQTNQEINPLTAKPIVLAPVFLSAPDKPLEKQSVKVLQAQESISVIAAQKILPEEKPVLPETSQPLMSQNQIGSVNADFLHLPDSPNLVLGRVKDSRNKVLQNMIVEINDKDGNTLRTFKTNASGQFSAATPLLNGIYQLIVFDPQKKQEFQPMKISLTGEIFKPVEVVSVDAREKLRRELFG